MRKIVIRYLATGAFIAAGFALPGCAAAQNSLPLQVTENCQACHGPDGNSASATVPRLNGQQADYMVVRLKSFLAPGSQDPHAADDMWEGEQPVNDTTLAAIAQYYAGATPTLPRKGVPLRVEGEKVYVDGDLAERVPPCRDCHGAHGEGQGTIPRIAGQHADYLKSQLERLRMPQRAGNIMHSAAHNLTSMEIEAVVAYLAGD